MVNLVVGAATGNLKGYKYGQCYYYYMYIVV